MTAILLVLITFMFTALYYHTLTSSFHLYEVVRSVIINLDEHCYNHIEVVCYTVRYSQLSQYDVIELF